MRMFVTLFSSLILCLGPVMALEDYLNKDSLFYQPSVDESAWEVEPVPAVVDLAIRQHLAMIDKLEPWDRDSQ
jgi:hypothetical protein